MESIKEKTITSLFLCYNKHKIGECMKKIIILILLLITPTLVNAETNYLYDVLKNEAESNGLAKEYTGEHHDSFTKEPSKKIYHWYAPSNQGNNTSWQVKDKWNVIFVDFCWQMIRTTDTGGVKLLYNGVPNEGKCRDTTLDDDIGNSAFSTSSYSLAFVGYMYNPDTLILSNQEAAASNSIYGNGVIYDGENYTLTNTSTTFDNTHHYTCNNSTGVCSAVRYYLALNGYYIEINDGRTIEDCIYDMLSADNVNKTNSTIKTFIDNWYESNMTNYTNKIEDTIYCNDRTIKDLGGWDPNGELKPTLSFNSEDDNKNLSCINETDKFSINNPKARLKYPIGLLTSQEVLLFEDYSILQEGTDPWFTSYWLINPANFYNSSSYVRSVNSSGYPGVGFVANTYGVRPVVSLKPGTRYSVGDGSKNNPYVIDLNSYYKVTVKEPIKKGDIEFDVADINNLEEGTKVNFKIVPNKGYILKDLKIIDELNNNINYTTTDNINFKFTMPATDVTIKPQYKEINIPNPNTKRQILLIVISVIILVILTILFIKKKKRLT